MGRDDRYRAPTARIAERDASELIDRPPGLLALAIIVPLALAFVAAIVWNSMPGYAATFVRYGLDQDGLTRCALRSYPVFAVLAILSAWFSVRILQKAQRTRAQFRSLRRIELAIVAISAIVGGFVFYGVLKPLMQLASVL